MFQRVTARFDRMIAPPRRWFYWFYTVMTREKNQLLEEATQMRDLMPLIMKQRNGYKWTAEDRKQIRTKLRRLSKLSPYLVPLLLPGGFLMLPVLSWWMDRRRQKRGSIMKQPEAEKSDTQA